MPTRHFPRRLFPSALIHARMSPWDRIARRLSTPPHFFRPLGPQGLKYFRKGADSICKRLPERSNLFFNLLYPKAAGSSRQPCLFNAFHSTISRRFVSPNGQSQSLGRPAKPEPRSDVKCPISGLGTQAPCYRLIFGDRWSMPPWKHRRPNNLGCRRQWIASLKAPLRRDGGLRWDPLPWTPRQLNADDFSSSRRTVGHGDSTSSVLHR